MRTDLPVLRVKILTFALAVPLLLAGCTSGSILGNEETLTSEPATSDASPDSDAPFSRIRRAKLNVPCPAASVRKDTQTYVIYGRGKDVPENVKYQGSIRELAAECVRGNDGGVLVRIGVIGRVIAGPKGSAGAVKLPIRVAFVKDDEVIYSKLFQQELRLTDGQLSQPFSLVVDDIPHNSPSTGTGRVLVGFDSRK